MKQFKKVTDKQLGELLIERGVIDHDQSKMALSYQKEKGGMFGEVLVALRFATEEDIAQAITFQYGYPYLPLSNYEIAEEVVKSVPENLCREFSLIPIDKIGKSLTLAMSNPLNLQAIEEVELITGCTVQIFVSTLTDIKNAIDKYYKLTRS